MNAAPGSVELMPLLWQRLEERFGQARWRDARGAVDGAQYLEWVQGLRNHSREQLARGVSHIQKWPAAVLPTVADFSRLCFAPMPPPPVPPPARNPVGERAHPEVRDHWVKQINEMLYGPDGAPPPTQAQ